MPVSTRYKRPTILCQIRFSSCSQEDGIKGPEKTGRLSSVQSNATVHGKLQSFFLRFLHLTENASIGGLGQRNVMSDLASLENKSIHARVDTLESTNHSLPDKVQQLLSIMKEQLRSLPHVTWRHSHSRPVTYQTHKHQTILTRWPV